MRSSGLVLGMLWVILSGPTIGFGPTAFGLIGFGMEEPTPNPGPTDPTPKPGSPTPGPNPTPLPMPLPPPPPPLPPQ